MPSVSRLRRENIPRFLSDIGSFHYHESLDGLIVFGRNLKEIGIRIANDTLEARTALSFATQDTSRFHGNENQLLGGFIVTQDKYQIEFQTVLLFWPLHFSKNRGIYLLFVQRGFLDGMWTT